MPSTLGCMPTGVQFTSNGVAASPSRPMSVYAMSPGADGVRFALRGGLLRGDIAHDPWPLQPAEVELADCDMFRVLGPAAVRAAGIGGRELAPPVVHFSSAVDVRAAAPVRA